MALACHLLGFGRGVSHRRRTEAGFVAEYAARHAFLYGSLDHDASEASADGKGAECVLEDLGKCFRDGRSEPNQYGQCPAYGVVIDE